MQKVRSFISFDFDHDEDLKTLLVGQSKNSNSPFEIADWSIKEHISSQWKEKAKSRIRACEVAIIICGQHTDTATGVAAELSISKDEHIPYFLLNGRSGVACKKPTSAASSDKIYDWTWPNLSTLIHGNR